MSTAAIHVLVRSNLYQKQDCTLNVYISSSHTRPCTVKPVSITRLYFKCVCQQQLYTSLYSQTCIKNNNVLYMFMSASDIHVLVQSNLYQKQECTLNVYVSIRHQRHSTVKPVSKTRMYFKCVCQHQTFTSLYSQTCMRNITISNISV